MQTASILADCRNSLGEGPVWNHNAGELMWVDYNEGLVCRFHLTSKKYSATKITETVMVAIPTSSNNLIVAVNKRICIYDPDKNEIIKEVIIQENKPDNRLNDGKCDANNRLWIGTMNNSAENGEGALYKINADLSYEKMDVAFTLPNGIAWDKRNKKMFVVDSMMKKIFCYDFDLEKGVISNKSILIDTAGEKGLPDGMAIDEEDNLWVAFWQGGCVVRYETKTGKVLKRIKTPADIPSSCCFGGEELDTLFITSSRKYDTIENIRKFPMSGGLFTVKPGVKGMITNFFNED